TPGTVVNEFKEEHYRRIGYANEHFAADVPGWKTDRGRIYITYGPPDEISVGTFYAPPREQGGGPTSTYPFQQWRYRFIEGVGTNVVIEFVWPQNALISERLAQVDREIADSQRELALLSSQYTENHPEVKQAEVKQAEVVLRSE